MHMQANAGSSYRCAQSKALSLAPEGVVKQPMEMEGRGATNQARGSSAGSSATGSAAYALATPTIG
jgi:hypothetical protein